MQDIQSQELNKKTAFFNWGGGFYWVLVDFKFSPAPVGKEGLNQMGGLKSFTLFFCGGWQ